MIVKSFTKPLVSSTYAVSSWVTLSSSSLSCYHKRTTPVRIPATQRPTAVSYWGENSCKHGRRTTTLSTKKTTLLTKLSSSESSSSSKGTSAVIVLREATIADLDLVQYWDEQPHVQASDPTDDDDDDDWDWQIELHRTPIWREQLIAEIKCNDDDDTDINQHYHPTYRPIGLVQIIDPAQEESHYWGVDIGPNQRAIDIWIGNQSDLGKGYGTIMMHLAIERCFANGTVSSILIDPLVTNTRACTFYERLGFQFVQYKTFGNHNCCVYRLNRTQYYNLR